MDELLALAQDAPRRVLEAGETLLAHGTPAASLSVLLDGALEVRRDGVAVARIAERGSCVGEISLLLGTTATADVVASEPSTVAVIEGAPELLRSDPRLGLVLGRVLAHKLQTMTNYLVDLRRQYADHEGGLGMVDVVLGHLMQAPGGTTLGSERDPDPEF